MHKLEKLEKLPISSQVVIFLVYETVLYALLTRPLYRLTEFIIKREEILIRAAYDFIFGTCFQLFLSLADEQVFTRHTEFYHSTGEE